MIDTEPHDTAPNLIAKANDSSLKIIYLLVIEQPTIRVKDAWLVYESNGKQMSLKSYR